MQDIAMFAEVNVNGNITRYLFSSNGRLIREKKKATPRKDAGKEDELENALVRKLKIINFEVKNTEIYSWLKNIYHGMCVSKEKSLVIAELVCHFCDLIITREFYRRKETVIYWLQQHFDDVYHVFSNYPTVLYWSGKSTVIQPPQHHALSPAQVHIDTPAQIQFNSPEQIHIDTQAQVQFNTHAQVHIDTPTPIQITTHEQFQSTASTDDSKDVSFINFEQEDDYCFDFSVSDEISNENDYISF